MGSSLNEGKLNSCGGLAHRDARGRESVFVGQRTIT